MFLGLRSLGSPQPRLAQAGLSALGGRRRDVKDQKDKRDEKDALRSRGWWESRECSAGRRVIEHFSFLSEEAHSARRVGFPIFRPGFAGSTARKAKPKNRE